MGIAAPYSPRAFGARTWRSQSSFLGNDPCIDLSLGRLPDPSWRRCPGPPQNSWLDQLCRDNGTPPAELWRRAVTRWRWTCTLGDAIRSPTTTCWRRRTTRM